jgi:hypothetical protein
MQRQDHRAQIEAHPAGNRRHGCAKREGLRQIAVIRSVMLHQADPRYADPVGKGGHLYCGMIKFLGWRCPFG